MDPREWIADIEHAGVVHEPAEPVTGRQFIAGVAIAVALVHLIAAVAAWS